MTIVALPLRNHTLTLVNADFDTVTAQCAGLPVSVTACGNRVNVAIAADAVSTAQTVRERTGATLPRPQTPANADLSAVSSSTSNDTQTLTKNAGRGVFARLRATVEKSLRRPVYLDDSFDAFAAFDPLSALADNDFAALTDYLFGADEPPIPAVDAKTARADMKARGIRAFVPGGYELYGFGSFGAAARSELRQREGAVVLSFISKQGRRGVTLIGIPLPPKEAAPTQLPMALPQAVAA